MLLLRMLVPLGVIAATAVASYAQYRALPAPPSGSPFNSIRSGLRGRLVIGGSFGSSYFGPSYVSASGYLIPYGIVEPRVSVHIISPVPAPRILAPDFDLSGIDLDVTRPPWAKDRPMREALPPAPPDEIAKRVDPPKIEPAAPALKPKAPDPLEPRDNPGEEGLRLTALGLTAFRSQEYGLAARKFSQALEADPAGSRAYFLLGQAYFALGKYRDAVQTIGLGLGLDPAWPKKPFQPRFDLYADHPEDWQRHVTLLADAQDRQPNSAGYLFLLAHQRWFDDQRALAVRQFRQVRPLVADPVLVDLFLKAAPP